MDARSLGELIDRCGPGLTLYARQWTSAPEDAVQEAFIKLSRLSSMPDQPSAWLYRVVRNQAISQARVESRQRKHETRAAQRSEPWFGEDDSLDVDAVTAALARLPDVETEVVVLHLWGGLTFAEIAAIIGTTASSAHRWYGVALERLRERLDVPCPKRPTA